MEYSAELSPPWLVAAHSKEQDMASLKIIQTDGTTTILSAGAVAAAPTLAQYKAASCIKTGTDQWFVIGGVA